MELEWLELVVDDFRVLRGPHVGCAGLGIAFLTLVTH